jgi:hypothetical protein
MKRQATLQPLGQPSPGLDRYHRETEGVEIQLMAYTEFFAGIPVADYVSALPWYGRLWGRPPDFFPQEGEAVWQITEHAWVYVVTDVERAGNGLITILVDDLDGLIARISERGIDVGPVQQVGDAVPGLRISDPEGNRITFGQPPAGEGS